MDLYLYNSLTRKKEKFVPINPPNVGLYTCGPTVYNFAHIGNLRTYVFNDVLQRVLLYNEYKIKRVMNVTDVGHLTGDRDMGMDKVEEAAKERGMNAWELSNYYLDTFKNDMRKLNLLSPTIWEKATDTIPDQVNLIKTLEEKGYTYKTSDGIYFDTSKYPEYGKMSSLDKKGMREAARMDFNKERKNPSDFALWKFNVTGKKRQMEWGSPWGIGFPGWHIECSAISLKHLGNPFDIHTGAIDHKETHHPNEIAQTECATGRKMANFWLHAGFLNTQDEEKMSKSKGNFITLQTLIDRGFDPMAFKLYTYGIHYRQTSNFSWHALEAAQKAYTRLCSFVMGKPGVSPNGDTPDLNTPESGLTLIEEYNSLFANKINDDLNMPSALAQMWNMLKDDELSNEQKLFLLFDWDKVFGLGLKSKINPPAGGQKSRPKDGRPLGEKVRIPEQIRELIEKREELRKEKKFKEADIVRKEIEEHGFTLEDTSGGTHIINRKF